MIRNTLYLLILIICIGGLLAGCAKQARPKNVYVPNKRIEISPTMQQVIFNLVQTKLKLKYKTKPKPIF